MSRIAMYPGSFDPITLGHLDIIKRGSAIFDEIVIAVANNTAKKALFSNEERVEMIRACTSDIKNLRIELFDGLVVDFARNNNINVIMRGLRMISDFEYELQMALTNRRLADDVETLFLMPSENYSFLSSTLIKEAASLGADISSFVPENVIAQVKEKYST